MNTKNYFRNFISALFMLMILTDYSFAQSAGDYRSVASGNWSDLSIWQRYDGASWLNVGASPTSSDGVITIQSPNNVTVNIGVTADEVVVNNGATLDNQSSLTIADGPGTDLNVNGTFNLNGGTLSGAGLIECNSGSSFNWIGGYFDLSGTINVNIGSAMTISSSNNKFFYNSGTINNYATCTWTGGAGIYMYYGAPSFNNYGTLNINTDAAGIWNYYVGTCTFTNEASGTLNKIGGAGETQFQSGCTYNNYGTIAVSSGTLSLMGTGNNYAIMNTSSAGTLNFPSGICHAMTGATFTGTGIVTITGGVFSIDGMASATGCAFNWSSGNMAGGSTFNFNAGSSFNWQGGYFDVSGTINVNASAAMTISSGNNKFFYNNGIINNYATCTWTGGAGIYMYYGTPAFNNYGTLNINTDAAGIWNYYVGSCMFTNQATGIVNKIGGTGETQFQSSCNYYNYGTMTVSSGTLSLMGTGYDYGIVNTTSTGTLNIPSGTCHVMPGATFTGTGNVNVTGGVFSIDGTASAQGCAFNLSSGNIAGGGTFDFNSGSSFNWQGGYFDVSGTINVNASAAMTISSGNNKFYYNSGTINNFATCTWTGGAGIYMYYGNPSFNNYGTLNINTDAAGMWNYYVGTSTFTNESGGVVNKVGGTGETQFQSNCTYTNYGTIAVSSGTLSLMGTGNDYGIVNNTSGGILNFPSGICHVMTGATFTGAGNVNITGGVFSTDGNASAQNCSFNWSSGNMAGAATFDFNSGSSFNWQGGYFDVSGTINVSASAAMTISSGNNKFFYNSGTLNNYATCTWNGTGGIYMYYGTPTFNNYGTLNITADAGIYNYYVGTCTFNNQSTSALNKTGGTGTYSFQSNCTFNNAGSTGVTSGILAFYTSPNPHSGTYVIGTGSSVYAPLNISYTGTSFTNNGTVNFNSLNFNGASNQLLDGTGSVDYLSFNSANGATLGGTQTVNYGLTLNNGLVTMGNNNMILGTSATLYGGSSSTYFITNGTGGFKRLVNNNNINVFFPIGTATSYLPANMQLTGTTDNFTARVINQLNYQYDNSNTGFGTLVTSNTVGKTWVIKEDVTGGSNATVTLQWNGADELVSFNRANADIFNFDGTNWQHNAFGGSAGGNPYTISRSGVTSFREFAVSDNLSVLNFTLSCINNYYTVCLGSTINIPYVAGGIFGGGNVFSAELSDATGSFVSPTVIGTDNTASGTIVGTIPPATPAGTNYRIRITSTNPVVTSLDNGSPITISGSSSNVFYQDNDGDGYGNPAVSITACSTPAGYVVDNTDCDDNNNLYHSIPVVGYSVSPFLTVCAGTPVTLSGTGATTYSWTGGITNAVAFTPSSTTTYTLTGSNGTGGCTNTITATVTVNPLPTSTITAGGATTFCAGGSVTLSASGSASTAPRYVSNIVAYSSQYSGGNWSAAQIIGAPNTYPSYGDIGTAWTSSTPDGQREFLILGFASPAPIRYINIYETYRPGSIDTVYVKNPNTNLFEIVYTATATPAYDSARILHINFPLTSFNVSEIRIAINSPAVSSWNEIDAVAIGGGDSYVWTPGNATTQSINATTSGSYTVAYTNSNGCTATSSPVVVTANALPTVSATITPSNVICAGTSVTITGTGANSYSWTGGITNGTPFTPSTNSGPTGVNTTNSSLFIGLRKLVTSYSGYGIQLRRDSDNATMDFGFVGYDLDIAAIATFLGGANGYCTTLYDQSGNGHNVTQGNASQQPLFVPTGLNGRPVLHFNTSQFMQNTTNFPSPFTVVYGATQTGPSRGRVLSSTGNNWLLGWWAGYKASAYFEGWVNYPGNTPDSNPYIYSGASNGSNSQVYENGTLIANNSGGLTGPNGINLNGSGLYGERSDCDFMDVMVFNAVLSNTDRAAAESNISNYYNIVTANNTLSYTVTGTAANGCTASYTQNVTVNPIPVVGSTATPAGTICVGNSVTLAGTGATSYSWTGGVSNGVAFSPSSTNTYTVTGTDGNGCTNSATNTVTVNSALTIGVSATNMTVCSGSATTLSATGATTYSWMPGNLSGASVSVSPTSTTTYTVTGSTGAGCTNSQTITINVNPLPTVGYSSPSTINVCTGTSVTLNGTGATTYSWSGGISNGAAFIPSTTTTYTVTGTDGIGCSNTATAHVTVGGTYTLSTSATNVNCGQNDGTATAIVTGGNIGSGSGLLSYTASTNFNSFYTGTTDLSYINDGDIGTGGTIWNPTSTPFEMTMTFASSVRIDSVKIKGGQFNGNYNIPNLMQLYRGTSSGTLLSSIVPTYTYDNYTISNNQSSQIYTWVITPNGGAGYSSLIEITCYGSTETYTYQWSSNAGSQTTPTATALGTGTYTVTVTDANSCSQSATQNVTNANPLTIGVNVSPSAAVCSGQSVTLNGTGALTYSWTGGVINGTAFTPSSTTTYTVTGTDGSGCTGTATQAITVNPPPTVSASATATSICIGGSTTLSATGAISYNWMPGNLSGASVSVSPTTITTYTVTGTNANGCTNTSTIQIVVNSLPSVAITPSGSTTFCTGGSIALEAGIGYSSYLWSTGGTSHNIGVNSSGTYSVTVTNSNGCANSASIVVTVSAPPTVTAGSNSPVCSGSALNLTATGGTTYSWTGPNSYTSSLQNPTIASPSTANSGTYTVTATNAGGCSTTATTAVTINPNHAPTLTFTGNAGFVTDVVNPSNSLPTAYYRFEVRYTDADGDFPANTYPRLQMDFEGNGSMADANDRIFFMQEVNSGDVDVTDGKDYYFLTTALPEGDTWLTTIVASDGTCSSAFGAFNEPDVLRDVDVSIFANDISFSNPHPNPGDVITVFATIHNASGRTANNFTAHLRNQFDTTIVYPDITIASLPSLPNNNSVQVSWSITTPALPAWCPMQVFIDYSNVLAEPNELDNQAIRPFTNGNYTLPGDILITAAPGAPLYPSNSAVSICGHAQYEGTAVPLPDPSCAGATVSAIIVETGQTSSTYTNSLGDYCLGFTAPVTAGTYHVNVHVTDYTLDGDTTTTFDVYFYQPPPCIAPDLVTSISLSGSTVSVPNYNCTAILAGQSLTGTATVTNAGTSPSPAGTSLLFNLPDGTPIPGPFIIPALNPNDVYTVSLPAMTFSYPVSTYISSSIDAYNIAAECSEYNNNASACILVLPPLPDIVPSGYAYGTAYQCNWNSIPFRIDNIGGVATGTFQAKLTIYNPSLGVEAILYQTVSSLNPLTYTVINFTHSPLVSGNYTFTLECDLPNVVTEVNEGNNSATSSVYFYGCSPDLYVYGCGSLDVQPIDPTAGGNITIYATVANGGQSLATGPFVVDFNVAGVHYPYNFTGNLAPGASQQVSITATAPAYGNNTLTVDADAYNVIAEASETNNGTTASLCWDFALTNYACYHQYISNTAYVGHPVTFSTGMYNFGLYEASHAQVLFEVSGPGLTGWVNLGYVQSYADITCSCPIGINNTSVFAFPQVGNYVVRMTADFNNQYSECNEGNNVLQVPVNVSNYPDYVVYSQFIAPSLLNPDVNQTIDIDVTYENIGSGSTDSMEVYTQLDVTPHDSIRAPGLIGGYTNTVHMTTPWSSSLRGVHIIRAIVDHNGEIAEGNELNNEATRAIIVGQSPNLLFTNFAVSTASPNINSVLTITASVHNNGYDYCDASYQLFYLDNTGAEVLIYQQPIHVDTGATLNLSIPWLVIDPRTTIIGRISNGNPVEYDITDNEATAQIGIVSVSTNSTNAACATAVDGVARVIVNGGQPPYQKQWSNGGSGDSIVVAPGTYIVTVTDFENFVVVDSVTVGAGPAYSLVASAGTNGTITPNGTTSICSGYSQTYTITPSNGFAILDVLVDGLSNAGAIVSGTYTFTNIGANHTISATFVATCTVPVGSASNIVICNGAPSNLPLNSTITGTTFTWTSTVTTGNVVGNGTCSNGCGTTISDVLTNLGAVHGVVQYTVTPSSGSCTGAPFTVNVTVGTVPATPVISGPNSLCGLTTAIYTVAAVAEATNYTWTVPTGVTGMTITSGQGTTSLHVNISAGTVTGNVTCTASNNCGNSGTATMAVTKKPAVPGTIQGPTSVCGLTSATYFISPVFNATSYGWTVPAGMSITGGTGTTQITVSISGTFISGNVGVTAINNCGNVPGTSITVTGHVPATPVTLSGPANVCGLTTANYSITPVAGATGYSWSVAGAGVIVGSATGTSVTVALNGTAGGSISSAATNVCGTGTPKTLNLVVTAIQPATIAGPTNTCGMTTATYSVTPVGTGYTYNWSLTLPGWSIATGQGTNTISVNIPPTTNTSTYTGMVRVTSTNTCGNTSLFRTLSVTACHSAIAMNNEADSDGTAFSSIYPNPASSEFTIDVSFENQELGDKNQEVRLEMFDVLGNLVVNEKHQVVSGTNSLKTNIEQFNNGIYFIRLVAGDNNVIYSDRLIKQ